MNVFSQTTKFLSEVIEEFKKVTWPTRRETIYSTIMVVIIVIFFAIYVGCVDFILSRILAIVLR